MGKPVRIEKATLSYPHLFTPHAAAVGSPEKFGAAFLLTKGNPEHDAKIKEINGIVMALIKEEFKGKKPSKMPPLHKGWEKYEDNELYADKYIINAYSKEKPALVDANLDDILDKAVLYPGCVVNAALDLYVYRQPVTGIAFGLNGVQWVGNGDRLDSRPSKKQMFDTLDGAEMPEQEDDQPFEKEEDENYDWM